MGLSFKVAKVGTRYRPKVNQIEEEEDECSSKKPSLEGQDVVAKQIDVEDELVRVRDRTAFTQDPVLSFLINLFPGGFCIGNSDEELLFPLLQGVPKLLHPYDRASKMLFSAIEYGWLPGDFFDDIPCNFVDGALACEEARRKYIRPRHFDVTKSYMLNILDDIGKKIYMVRDYRACLTESWQTACTERKFPVVQKVRLQICMENVVKDMSLISDDSWTYNDLLEVESRILNSLQPELSLDPTPRLDKLCQSPVRKKINLGIFPARDKSNQNMTPAANLVPTNLNSQSYLALRDSGVPCTQQSAATGFGNKHQKSITQEIVAKEPNWTPESNFPSAESSLSAIAIPSNSISLPEYDLNLMMLGSSLAVKRDCLTAQLNLWPKIKRLKQVQPETAQVPPEFSSIPMDSSIEPNSESNNIHLHQQQEAEGAHARFGSQFPTNESMQVRNEGNPRLLPRMPCYQEQIEDVIYKCEMEKMNSANQVTDIGRNRYSHMQSQVKQFSSYARSHVLPSVPLGQIVDRNLRRDDSTKKRRSSLLSREHAPDSSRSGESGTISMGVPCSISETTVIGLQKENAASSLTANSGLVSKQKGNRTSPSAKRKGNSLSKTVTRARPASSLSHVKGSCMADSPSNGGPSPPLSLPSKAESDPILENFQKIETVVKRYGIKLNKCKPDQVPERKSFFHDPKDLSCLLNNKTKDTENREVVQAETENGEVIRTDKTSMSKTLLEGSSYICRMRVLTFNRPRRIYQGKSFWFTTADGAPVVIHEFQKLFMTEKPNDRTVELHLQYGGEQSDPLACPLYILHPLLDTHHADLFADQFSSLMRREGYLWIDDRLQPNPSCNFDAFNSEQPDFVASSMLGTGSSTPTLLTLTSDQSPYMLSPSCSSTSVISTRPFPSKNDLTGRYSDTSLCKPHQVDDAVHFNSLNQLHHAFFQRSSMFTGNGSNPLGITRTNSSNQMVNDAAQLQFLLQQQEMLRQQQHQNMQNEMVGGLGAALQPGGGFPGLGNIVGLDAMNNISSIGRSVSAPIGSHIPGLGNVAQNQNLSSPVSSFGKLSPHLLSGRLSSAAQASIAAEFRQENCRGRAMPTGVSFPGNSADGIMVNNLMHDGLLSSQTMNRGRHLDQFQRVARTTIGPSNMSGMNFDVNNMQQRHQERYQQQLQSQRYLDQAQQMCSSLRLPKVLSLSGQVGSSINHFNPQHACPEIQISHHQVSEQMQVIPLQQRSEMTAMQQMNNVMMGHRSPQVSCQIHGSVASSSNSPVEAEGGQQR